MTATTMVSLSDGVRLIVPESLELITPYVLAEQHDWFEDEIKFLRRALQPGDSVIDIGANYGVYTLSMARVVGAQGRVWAYEPSSTTRALLASSVEANPGAQVTLLSSAVAAEVGTARLSMGQHAELNALVRGPEAAAETVPLTTLDAERAARGWRGVTFLKIDAEGEEANIIAGGHRFFAEESPLVMYEVKSDRDHSVDLVDRFAALGYESFRLVPGLDVLVPFDSGVAADAFLLNLFCCKPDRAVALAERGLLAIPDDLQRERERFRDDPARAEFAAAHSWRAVLPGLACAREQGGAWVKGGVEPYLDQALSLHTASRVATLPAAVRAAALEWSLSAMMGLCESNPTPTRLSTLARVASEFGARALAVGAIHSIEAVAGARGQISFDEPLLAPSRRFDTVPTAGHPDHWLVAGMLEQLELLGAHSSFYQGASGLPRLTMIAQLGYGSPEMARRLKLVRERFPPA